MITVQKSNREIQLTETISFGECLSSTSIFLKEHQYDQFVTDLEAKARELWPDKFPKDHTKDFELINHSDGSTECRKIIIAEHESIREQDRLNRMQQIPIGGRK